jgi:hypothetical protein
VAIQQIRILLNASHEWGTPNKRSEFVKLLGVKTIPFTFSPQPSSDAAINIEIVSLGIADYKRFGTERYEEFEKDLQNSLGDFAEWLGTIPTENMDRVRTSGLKVMVLVTFWMDQDQMEFNLLPSLSSELGRLGLKLYLMSNS